jgi:hypothetical protein
MPQPAENLMTILHTHNPLSMAGLALALCFLNSASFAGPGTQTEDDIYVGKKRPVQGVNTPSTALPAKPPQGAGTSPNTGRSAASTSATVQPMNQVRGVNTPGTSTPLLRPGAGVSPNTAAAAKKNTAQTSGDDDLDDLEVERRKVQGVNTPGTGTPQIRPGAGTSPNTARTAPGPMPPR